jgi:hypothetical protein
MNTTLYALANMPDVITVGIVWNTDSPTIDFIYEVLDLISGQLG